MLLKKATALYGLSPSAAPCSQREPFRPLPRRAHKRWQRQAAAAAGDQGAQPAARAGAAVEQAPPPPPSGDGNGMQPDSLYNRSSLSSSSGLLDPSLAKNDADVTGFLTRQYGLYERRQAGSKAKRALAAKRAADPSATALSLEEDVLPKLELLEALCPGLGWQVFRSYPEQFGSPEAAEAWRIAGAMLFTEGGLQPDEVAALMVRHIAIFRQAVEAPDNLRRLLAWLRRDLGLTPAEVLKLCTRCPLVLQADVESVLKPRLAYMVGLGQPQERVVKGLIYHPELLAVDTGVLASKVRYLTSSPAEDAEAEAAASSSDGAQPNSASAASSRNGAGNGAGSGGGGGPGLSAGEVGTLLVREPAAVLHSLDRLREVVDWLRHDLGLPPPLLRTVVAQGGVCKYPVATLADRAAYWTAPPPGGLGFSADELRAVLSRLPRLFLYPLRDQKYQAKLRFLTEEMGLQPRALLTAPKYLTYSLPGRIAPRAAAARDLALTRLPPSKLSPGDAAFVRWLGVTPEQYAEWLAQWKAGPEAAHWATASGETRARGRKAAAAAADEEGAEW